MTGTSRQVYYWNLLYNSPNYQFVFYIDLHKDTFPKPGERYFIDIYVLTSKYNVVLMVLLGRARTESSRICVLYEVSEQRLLEPTTNA